MQHCGKAKPWSLVEAWAVRAAALGVPGSIASWLSRMVARAAVLSICDRLISYLIGESIIANESQPCNEVASKWVLRTPVKVAVLYREKSSASGTGLGCPALAEQKQDQIFVTLWLSCSARSMSWSAVLHCAFSAWLGKTELGEFLSLFCPFLGLKSL